MAIPQTNIDWTDLVTELGMPAVPTDFSVICTSVGQNPFSYWGQGALSVDGDSSAQITYSPPYSISDSRLYNQNATIPSGPADDTVNYVVGETTAIAHPDWWPEEMNIWAFAFPGDYGCYIFYFDLGDRASEISEFWTDEIILTFGGYAPFTDHPRYNNKLVGSPQTPTISGIDVTGMTTPNDLIYLDTYIGDVGRARKINVGESKEGGYTTLTFHEQQQPYVTAGSLSPNPGDLGQGTISPYYTVVSVGQAAPCEADVDINHTAGSTSYSFYVSARGLISSTDTFIPIDDCSVWLTLDGSAQSVYSGAFNAGNGFPQLVSGSDLWRTWAYDDVATISITNAVYGSSGTCA